MVDPIFSHFTELEGWGEMMQQGERLKALIRILDAEDYRYIRAYDFRIEARFRRKRMRIYREELRGIASDVVASYHVRLSHINAAGRWNRYPHLVLTTGSMFVSIAKLWMAGALFGLRLPVIVNLATERGRLERYLTAPAISA